MKYQSISKTQGGKIRLQRILAILGAAVVLIVSFPILVVWHGEYERKVLMDSYQIPKNLLGEILSIGRKPISTLMLGNETTVCTINSYSGVENVQLLSKIQRDSLPKRLLPSEDLTWYLLFFTDSSVSRIFMIDVFSIAGISRLSPTCIDRDGFYETIRRKNQRGDVIELELNSLANTFQGERNVMV